jgi:hypothetical protein
MADLRRITTGFDEREVEIAYQEQCDGSWVDLYNEREVSLDFIERHVRPNCLHMRAKPRPTFYGDPEAGVECEFCPDCGEFVRPGYKLEAPDWILSASVVPWTD